MTLHHMHGFIVMRTSEMQHALFSTASVEIAYA